MLEGVSTSRSGSTAPSPWQARLRQPGWLLVPLRAFLGFTFTYAGLQKLANPDYLDPSKPTSVAAQMRALRHSSAIDPLVGLATHAPTFVGLMIAAGELAVGVGTLLGLYQRIAAVGGALLSLSFFLTVSWNTSPYYYGSDIVFVFAWVTLAAFGAGGVLSIQTWLRGRARASLRLGPEPAAVPVPATRLRTLCPRAGNCGMGSDGVCSRIRGCPVFPGESAQDAATRTEVDRRTALRAGTAAALTGGGVIALAGATAAIGRAVGGTKHQAASPPPATPAPTSAPASSHAGAGASTPSRPAGGHVIASAAQIPAGQAKSFTDPSSGNPAWLVHPSGSTFVAFSAVCTHAGCAVQYDPSAVQFVCPCHGGVYDARTGQVVQGPPPAPLQTIPVHVVGSQLQVD